MAPVANRRKGLIHRGRNDCEMFVLSHSLNRGSYMSVYFPTTSIPTLKVIGV